MEIYRQKHQKNWKYCNDMAVCETSAHAQQQKRGTSISIVKWEGRALTGAVDFRETNWCAEESRNKNEMGTTSGNASSSTRIWFNRNCSKYTPKNQPSTIKEHITAKTHTVMHRQSIGTECIAILLMWCGGESKLPSCRELLGATGDSPMLTAGEHTKTSEESCFGCLNIKSILWNACMCASEHRVERDKGQGWKGEWETLKVVRYVQYFTSCKWGYMRCLCMNSWTTLLFSSPIWIYANSTQTTGNHKRIADQIIACTIYLFA